MQPYFLFPIVFVIANVIPVDAYEYCARGKEAKLCRGTERRHIACYKEQIEPSAEYQYHYPMSNYFRDWLKYWHNHYRNEIACGNIKGKSGEMPQATRMRELIWDYELEYLASIHAGRCKIQHDQCRNTERFIVSGQNLAFYRTTSGRAPPLFRAYKSIFGWFDEYNDCPVDVIDGYRKIEGVKIGHFTVVANDRIARMGCAMTYCTGMDKGRMYYHNYLTCNYDNTNMPGYKVYEKGPTRSDCKYHKVGLSKNFSCLCHRMP